MICPSCNNDQVVTEHNFGALYTCPSCQAVYFLDFAGRPEYSEIENLELDQPLDMSSLPPTNLPDVVAAATDELPPGNEFSAHTHSTSAREAIEPIIQFNQNEFAADPSPFESFQPISNSFADAAKDISDYGNSESQIAHLNYDLKISGLDTAEIISGLKEAIEDSRFGWDASEIVRTIKNGEIHFEKMNPVKAYILAKRIQFIDVDKVWKQNAVG